MNNESVFGYFKHNVGEEDFIKLLLMSAGKALVSVGILLGALLAFAKLSEWYSIGFACLLLFTTVLSMTWACMIMFGLATSDKSIRFDFRNYKTWKYIISDILPLNKIFYIDENEFRDGYKDLFATYLLSWLIGILIIGIAYIIGVISLFFLAFVIAFLDSTAISTEFLYIAIPCTSSVIIMSILFLKLKWKKIWLDGFNWNLAAWCICSAIVITTIAFVTGVAIRRIAGFIGIEYTAILVSSYIIITAVYVYLDIKQWMARKARESIKASNP